MTLYLIIAGFVLLAVVLTYVATKQLAKRPAPQILVDAETEAWKKLEELLEFAADSKGDQKQIEMLTDSINRRRQNFAQFQAKVAAIKSV